MVSLQLEENGRISLPPAKQQPESEPAEEARVEEKREASPDTSGPGHACEVPPKQSDDTSSSPSQTNGQDSEPHEPADGGEVDSKGVTTDAANDSNDTISTTNQWTAGAILDFLFLYKDFHAYIYLPLQMYKIIQFVL